MGVKHVTVVAWDMGHNAVGRPYFLTDMLRRRYGALMIGPTFPAFGSGIWEPIRASDVEMRSFPGANLPEYVDLAERATRGLETDLVILCKPRFPGLLLATLLKRSNRVPVIADVDEWELSWTGSSEGLTLDEVESLVGERSAEAPYGPVWTRAAEELFGQADAVTSASPVLQEIYGGSIVPQVRDELVFDPARYDRDAVRAEFGYTPADRVILFLGTPKRFKGMLELAQAVERLEDPRYKLCVIGTIRDPADRVELARVAAGRTQLIDYRPVSEVPRLTLIGDLACLLQDPGHRATEHQLPAKLTELLAMGVPVLVRETPAMEPLLRDGLIAGLGDVSAATRISELFDDPDGMRAQAQRGRDYFIEELSYRATLEVLDRVFAGLEDRRGGPPPDWERAYRVARSVPRRPGPPPRADPTPAAAGGAGAAAPGDGAPAGVEIVGYESVRGRIERIRDGIVTGWAWNPATPGWRIAVRAIVDGRDVAGGVADLDQPGLADAGVGDGRHGFRIGLPAFVAREADRHLRIEAGGVRIAPGDEFETAAKPSSSWSTVKFALEEPVIGRVERVCDGVLWGWACKPDRPSWRATIRAIVDGADVGEARADLDRPELAASGLGDGRYGFRLALAPALATEATHRLRVEATGGVPIPASASFSTVSDPSGEVWDGVAFDVQDGVIGRVGRASDGIVSGWAYRSGAPAWRVWVRVIVDGDEAASGAADLDRPELVAAKIGDGRHGFCFELPALAAGTHHRVLVEAEGVALAPDVVAVGRDR